MTKWGLTFKKKVICQIKRRKQLIIPIDSGKAFDSNIYFL